MRAVFYWHIGSTLHWTPTIVFGPVNLSFRSDLFLRILVFSILGFSVTMALFYHGALFLVLAAGRGSGAEMLPRWIRTQLGFLDRWPTALKILTPFLVCAVAWMGLEPLLVWMKLIPVPKSFRHLFEQSMVMGASSYFVWKYFAAALVLLHLLNTYIYIGGHSLLTFTNFAAQRLLRPLRWLPLRLGPVDFAPVVFLAALFLGVELADRGLAHLYARLPF